MKGLRPLHSSPEGALPFFDRLNRVQPIAVHGFIMFIALALQLAQHRVERLARLEREGGLSLSNNGRVSSGDA